MDITGFADCEDLSSSLTIEDGLVSKTLNVFISSLFSDENICSRTEDDSISVNRELVNFSLLFENKICSS